MKFKITDNWLDNPELARARALALNYRDVETQGVVYKNIALPEGHSKEWQRIQDLYFRHEVKPVLDFHRLSFGSQQASTYIHTDFNFASHIAIHYLNLPEQCYGGTVLWKHKETGALRPREGSSQADLDVFNRDGLEEDRWIMQQDASMKWNRLVRFEADLFHSRYPRDLFTLFGNDRGTGRLVHVFFYNLKDKPNREKP